MTENTASAGSVTADALSAGNPAQPQPGADNGSAAQANEPWSGLPEDTRSWVTTKGYKTPADLAKSARELEQKLGSMISLPKDDAPKEELDKLYQRLGRPDTPDKYEFKRPEGLPPDLPYSDDLANASRSWMHQAGLNPKQAQAVHDGFVGYVAAQQQAAQEAVAKAVEATHDDLVKAWGGPPDSEGFRQKQALANRALKELGLVDPLKEAGILLSDGTLTKPQMAKALAAVGEAMFSEDTIGGTNAEPGENPFKRGADGKVKSPQAIGLLVKNDPERAKRLAREAGEPISNWMSDNPR